MARARVCKNDICWLWISLSDLSISVLIGLRCKLETWTYLKLLAIKKIHLFYIYPLKYDLLSVYFLFIGVEIFAIFFNILVDVSGRPGDNVGLRPNIVVELFRLGPVPIRMNSRKSWEPLGS